MGKVTKALCALAGAALITPILPAKAQDLGTTPEHEMFLAMAFMFANAQIRASPEYKADPSRGPALMRNLMQGEAEIQRKGIAELARRTTEISVPGKLKLEDCYAEFRQSDSVVGRGDFLYFYERHLARTGAEPLRTGQEVKSGVDVVKAHTEAALNVCTALRLGLTK